MLRTIRDSKASRAVFALCALVASQAWIPGPLFAAEDLPQDGEAVEVEKLIGGFDRTSKIWTLALLGSSLAVLATGDDGTIEEIGDVLQIALPVAALGSSYLADDRPGRRDFVKSLGTSTLLVAVLKEALDKARPNAQGLNSFPSGHTAAAFSGAGFINLRYGARWGAPALVLAGYTGASRIYAQKHFLDDVISGLSISLLANRYFVFPIDQDLTLLPLVDDDRTGLELRWKGSARRWHERSFDDPNLEPTRGWRYQWEFGGTTVDVNRVAPVGDGESVLPFLFDEANNPTVTARAALAFEVGERQEVALQVAPFEVRDFGRFAADTMFAGKVVPAGAELRSQYLLYDYRLRYRYLMRPSGRMRFHVGGGLSFQDLVTTLTWAGGEAGVEEGNFIPFVRLDGEIGLHERLWLAFETDLGRSGADRLLDTTAALRYQIHPRWDLGFGIRRIERTVSTDRVENRLERDQAVISVGYRF